MLKSEPELLVSETRPLVSETRPLVSDYFGSGPFHNIVKGVELCDRPIVGRGLYTTRPISKGSIVWQNRKDGPAEVHYNKIKISEIPTLSQVSQEICIRYGYQIDEDIFITPLTETDVILDYSNYWNHSCSANCGVLDENTWVALYDLPMGTELTIDYCMFDNNPYDCIEECLCGHTACRHVLSREDYKNPILRQLYQDHYMPYLLKKLK